MNKHTPGPRKQLIDDILEGVAFEDDELIQRVLTDLEHLSDEDLLSRWNECVGFSADGQDR